MKELSKSIQRRLHTPAFAARFFVGFGVDIGGKPDPLALYKPFFRAMNACRTWDREDGDAQFMDGIADNTFDFVHSSHCLEHMADPFEAVRNWIRICKPGGYIIVMVPDEDMYEQGIWPSSFNRDHKWTFTICKTRSWCSKSVNIVDLIRTFAHETAPVQILRLEDAWRTDFPRFDQSLSPVCECGIEFVLRKLGGQLQEPARPDRETRIHFNQYRKDYELLKSANPDYPPFMDDSDL